MLKATLETIAKIVGGNLVTTSMKDVIVEGVSTDTRDIKLHNLFIPLVGAKYDGHTFTFDAIKKGAIATLWDKNHPTPYLDAGIIVVDDTLKAYQKLANSYLKATKSKVIGITGSNGKTGTKDILASILEENFRVHKTAKNLNNEIGVPKTIMEMNLDDEAIVLEMGMERFGEISVLTNIANPDIAVITNIGDSHLLELGTKENIARAKFEILEGLKPDGIFIFNNDDDILREVIREYSISQRVIKIGTREDSDVIIRPIRSDESGSSFSIGEYAYSIPFIGKHQIYNVSVAITIAGLLGMDYASIVKGLSKVKLTGMRMELMHLPSFDVLNDCYKSNPQSLMSCIETVYTMKGYKNKILILSDMLELGENEEKLHFNVGEKIDRDRIDYVICVGDLAKEIYNGANRNFNVKNLFYFETKGEVIEKVREIISEDTLIMVKGSRGMKLEEIIEKLKEI
ncbi:UDP-N-acetylmuramoyl-tripeptide--D-alanyl-D-alanine ligase [Parvimonas sp. KA00067]|uniref:UDP-N-acetylmuramoyl-tripeptide--D-alanyl-D- alanine ligase n=1 Tax=Parvimonas sp. KA00067 TaxID=1588755 RepID=UPI0007933102|nr:UDP-N-acetylmuramoyl-tripeptide--D-alanyl-D-alanine ligase [Parvimonas sp. KA00067]KXB64453.1 UDP-N-acetylmuramoyl-tripeptide--D-alanyl-D-alanine ligase [Parvimonas sp. KA00067]